MKHILRITTKTRAGDPMHNAHTRTFRFSPMARAGEQSRQATPSTPPPTTHTRGARGRGPKWRAPRQRSARATATTLAPRSPTEGQGRQYPKSVPSGRCTTRVESTRIDSLLSLRRWHWRWRWRRAPDVESCALGCSWPWLWRWIWRLSFVLAINARVRAFDRALASGSGSRAGLGPGRRHGWVSAARTQSGVARGKRVTRRALACLPLGCVLAINV